MPRFADFCGFTDKKVKRWDRNEVPDAGRFEVMDHHHNMLRRLQILPHSHRGGEVKKCMSFLYLQQILDTEDFGLIYGASIKDLYTDVLKESSRLRALFPESYLMVSIIMMIDFLVGNDPDDYRDENWDVISKVINLLKSYRDVATGNIDPALVAGPIAVRELANNITHKWERLRSRYNQA